MHRPARPTLGPLVPCVAAVGLLLAGCADAGAEDPAATVAVTASDDACEVGTTDLTAGVTRFTVTNGGAATTEFYVLRADGVSVVSEVENIGPGLTRDLTVQLEAGRYVYACVPGQAGDGIRGDLTVTGAGAGT